MNGTPDLSRRRFLRGAFAGAAALSVVPVLPAAHAGNAPNNGKFVVVINLFGGNDGLNTVVPTHLQPYFDRRPALALTTGLHDLDGSWMLHPELANLRTLWTQDRLHVVNNVGYPNKNLSHFTSQNIYSFGVRDIDGNGDGRGWLGRFADAYCADPVEPMGVVSVGTGRRRDFEADAGEALALSSVAGFDFSADNNFQTDHRLRLLSMRGVLDAETAPTGDAALTVYGTSRQAYELVDRVKAGVVGWADPGTYPNTTLGNRLRVISELLQGRADFGTKVFYTGYGGFDTHSSQLARHASLLSSLDLSLEAFRADLTARGLWDDCVVLVISEFGRRNFQNGSAGTDHGHGNCFLVTGGAVDGGITGGYTEEQLNQNEPDHAYDFRELYADIIANHLGVSAAPVFAPESFVTTGDISLIR